MSREAASTSREIRGVATILAMRAKREPHRVALLVDGARGLTFDEWERRSNAAARGLVELGCRKGDRLGLFFSNRDWIDYAVAYVAALKAGAAAVHVSDALPAAEIERRFEQCRVKWVIHAPHLVPPQREHVLTLEQVFCRGQTEPVDVPIGPHDVADIVYTAGTTAGLPKPILVLHSDHLHTFHPEKHQDHQEFNYFLGPFPAGTSSSQNIILFGLSGTPTVLLLTHFEPDAICGLVERLGVQDMMVTPGIAVDLLHSTAAQQHDLSSVRTLATGAAAIPPCTLERLAAMFPKATIMHFYLSLESVPSMTTMVYDPRRPGAVGKPASGTALTVRDEAGNPVGPGEVGEIWMRTAGRIRRYEGESPEYPPTFADGWVRMGDLGYVDDDGYLYFFDRTADVIQCDGKRISTLRVENVLYEHPHVREACVVGIPHAERGQVVGAAVVPKPGLDVAELAVFAQTRLQEHEAPARILVEDSLPRGLIGKVLKREVRPWFDGDRGEHARAAHREKSYW